MKLIKNSGNDRVVDTLRESLASASSLDVATPEFSLFAFAEIRQQLASLKSCRLALPSIPAVAASFLGGPADRPFRNRLQARWLAAQVAQLGPSSADWAERHKQWMNSQGA